MEGERTYEKEKIWNAKTSVRGVRQRPEDFACVHLYNDPRQGPPIH